MANNLDDNRPIYLQIKEVIEDSIINGTIKVGDRVPSTNELAKFYKINPATARQGINELVMEEILQKQRGVGMFVTEEGKKKLMKNRQKRFYENFIIPLKTEANKLQISNKRLVEMIERRSEERRVGKEGR